MPGIVSLQFSVGNGAPATSLVEQDNVEPLQIKELQVMAIAVASRSAMQEKDRFTARRTASFPIELVAVVGRVVAMSHHCTGILNR
ncbi:hypothetical protein D3C73_1179410 [compost metagenome]